MFDQRKIMYKHISCKLSLFVIIFGSAWSATTMFNTVPDCEPFIDTHRLVTKDLKDHIRIEEMKLESLKRDLKVYQREHKKAKQNISNYLANPLNMFMLVKRLSAEIDASSTTGSWQFLSDFMMSTKYLSSGTKLATMQDLTRVAHGLSRLQVIYKLSIKKMADGFLDDTDNAYSSPMSAGDCYTLGRLLFNAQDYYGSLEWMKQARRKFHDRNDEQERYNFKKLDIDLHIQSAEGFYGFLERMVTRTYRVLGMDSNIANTVIRNVPHCGGHLDLERFFQLDHHNPSEEIEQEFERAHVVWQEWDHYTSLCRGESAISQQLKHRLSCYYSTNNNPNLRLVRIKTEQLHIKPNVLMFYDVISDDEIERFRNLAKLKFSVDKTADIEEEKVSVISRRISGVTGLRVSRPLQVTRYDPGEHFHYEHHNVTQKSSHIYLSNSYQERPDATVMFYMSEVPKGGATVFPKLDLTVFPKKNAALFWTHAYKKDHNSIFDTACPVLRGTMWSKLTDFKNS